MDTPPATAGEKATGAPPALGYRRSVGSLAAAASSASLLLPPSDSSCLVLCATPSTTTTANNILTPHYFNPSTCSSFSSSFPPTATTAPYAKMTLTHINNKLLNVWATGKSASGALGAPLDLSAPTLVFVHGLGSSQNYFYGLLPQLLPKANAVLMDSVGCAQSPVASEQPTLDSIVADINGVVDHFGVKDQVILVGHSMGGMVVLRAAELDAADRRRVRKIVLVGPLHPTPSVGEVFAARITSVEQARSVLGLADVVPETAVGSAASPPKKAFIRALISQQTPEGYAAMCRVIANSTAPDYSKVQVPALLLIGAEDKSTPYEGCVEVIEKALANVTAETYPGVGHWHCIEVPEKVSESISAFI